MHGTNLINGTVATMADEVNEVFVNYKDIHSAMGGNEIASIQAMDSYLQSKNAPTGKIGRTRLYELNETVKLLEEKRRFRGGEINLVILRNLLNETQLHFNKNQLDEVGELNKGVSITSRKLNGYSRKVNKKLNGVSGATKNKLNETKLELNEVTKKLNEANRELDLLRHKLNEKQLNLDKLTYRNEFLEDQVDTDKARKTQEELIRLKQLEEAMKVKQEYQEAELKRLAEALESTKVELDSLQQELNKKNVLLSEISTKNDFLSNQVDEEAANQIEEELEGLREYKRKNSVALTELREEKDALIESCEITNRQLVVLQSKSAEIEEELLDLKLSRDVLQDNTLKKTRAYRFYTSIGFTSFIVFSSTIVSAIFFVAHFSGLMEAYDEVRVVLTTIMACIFALALPYVGFNPSKKRTYNGFMMLLLTLAEVFCAQMLLREFEPNSANFFGGYISTEIRTWALSIVNICLFVYMASGVMSKNSLTIPQLERYLIEIDQKTAKTTMSAVKAKMLKDVSDENAERSTGNIWQKMKNILLGDLGRKK